MIAIRPADVDDAELIAQIRVTGWRESFGHLFSAQLLADLVADPEPFRRGIQSGSTVVVAELNGEVVGYAFAGEPWDADPPRDWELKHLYQYARVHGSGTGQALLEAAIGDRPTYLWTAEGNLRAQAFSRRNGFTPDGARKVIPEWENLAELRLVR